MIATFVIAWILKTYLQLKPDLSDRVKNIDSSVHILSESKHLVLSSVSLSLNQCPLPLRCLIRIEIQQISSARTMLVLNLCITQASYLYTSCAAVATHSRTILQNAVGDWQCHREDTVTQAVSVFMPNTRQNCMTYAGSLIARSSCGTSQPTNSITRAKSAAKAATSHSLQHQAVSEGSLHCNRQLRSTVTSSNRLIQFLPPAIACHGCRSDLLQVGCVFVVTQA